MCMRSESILNHGGKAANVEFWAYHVFADCLLLNGVFIFRRCERLWNHVGDGATSNSSKINTPQQCQRFDSYTCNTNKENLPASTGRTSPYSTSSVADRTWKFCRTIGLTGTYQDLRRNLGSWSCGPGTRWRDAHTLSCTNQLPLNSRKTSIFFLAWEVVATTAVYLVSVKLSRP